MFLVLKHRRLIVVKAKVLIALGATLALMPILAQDLPAFDWNGSLDHARTTGRMVRQAQRRENSAPRTKANRTQGSASTARTRQTCLNARRMAGGGDANPKLSRLLALCRRVGH